ncbi:MAG: HPr family phosphocarrier protein [Deltaproteobacteria bacterium]|nr:HPr family phosphocarrier protein [Deltaproteobacteria bacterium]NIS78560.1 HPr family phosphocarrier protein [Deltaproteobacteria bacterium]
MSELETSESTRVVKNLMIKNELGLHARAASSLANLASKFQSEIFIFKDGIEVNGKSIMGILMLAAPKGSMIKVSAEGDDADEAVKAIEDLVKRRFYEK